jgi:L-threonylcarbamoyladenylate synthase
LCTVNALRTRRYRPTPHNLRRLGLALRRGELVAAPTETVYGLAGNALDPRAVAAIYAAKGRPTTDPLIVHLASVKDLERVARPDPLARRLAAVFWPGPLTLVLPKTPAIPASVTAALDSVAVRVPAHTLFRQLIRAAGVPLAAPSANLFGYVSPTEAAHVIEGLGGRIPHVLDGGTCRVGIESTIVDLRDPAQPRLLRPGGVPVAALRQVLGPALLVPPARTIAPNQAAPAPGMLARHYSPRTPITLHRRLTLSLVDRLAGDDALLYFRRPSSPPKHPHVHWLCVDGRGETAARRLFAKLRELDGAGHGSLQVELAPAKDPWSQALNDRLQRAAARG